MGVRLGVYVREPGRSGSDRHGRFRREIRHRHLALLLDRSHSRDGLRRHFHDAVLLRLARPLRPGISAPSLRRKNARPQRHLLRDHDHFFSGISMYAIAKLIQTLHVFDGPFQRLGLSSSWIFDFAIVISAVVVLVYTFLGGLSSAIYNEVLQFFLIVAGFLPLSYLGLKNVGGWSGLKATLGPSFTHSWRGMGHASTNRLGVEWFGLAMGLGFVLSFGYWCTDFLVVQRAMAAKSMSAARRTPLIGAFPKMLFPFIVILPGLIAIALPTAPQGGVKIASTQAMVPGASTGMGLIPPKLEPGT